MAEQQPLTYAASGVDYDALDRFKRACQRTGRTTLPALQLHDMTEPPGIRGESAYLLETEDSFISHVEEGLGTKNIVADAMYAASGQRAYHAIGIDTVATIVNDMITSGALPVAVAMHAAVGDAEWFGIGHRGEDLADGFAEGCRQSGAVWGGGETPVLKGIVNPGAAVLAGSAIGFIKPKSRRITGAIRPGDAIIMLASTGIHANGITLCRMLADDLSAGYLTKLEDGTTFGQALLAPTAIYVPFVRACQISSIDLHYAVHITGHGWRKLMRLEEPFVYRIDQVPALTPLFAFFIQSGRMTPLEAYGTFNMGAGFAVYVDPADAPRCVELARQSGLTAWHAGTVEKQGQRKAVEIPSLGLTFEGDSLQVRG